MNPRTLKKALVGALLLASSFAHASSFKGLMERRALNDKSVTSRKEIVVDFGSKIPGPAVPNKKKGDKGNNKLGSKVSKKHPAKGGQIHQVKIVKLSKAGKKAGGK